MTLPSDLEQKRAAAIRYLRERGLWILDKGTPAPGWSSQQKAKPTAQVIPMLKMMRRNEEAPE